MNRLSSRLMNIGGGLTTFECFGVVVRFATRSIFLLLRYVFVTETGVS